MPRSAPLPPRASGSGLTIEDEAPLRVRYPTPAERRLNLRSGRSIERNVTMASQGSAVRRRTAARLAQETVSLYRSLFGHDQRRETLRVFLEEAFSGSTSLSNPLVSAHASPVGAEAILRYSRKQSHPKKLAPGFRRDTAPMQPDIDLSGEPNMPQTPTEALCASCSRPLRLDVPSLSDLNQHTTEMGRTWVLRCGHLTCSSCLYRARILRNAQRGAWRSLRRLHAVATSQPPDNRETADESEWVRTPHPHWHKCWTRSAHDSLRASKHDHSKLPAQSGSYRTGWTTCPVTECDGAGGDIAAEDDSGPWEIYI